MKRVYLFSLLIGIVIVTILLSFSSFFWKNYLLTVGVILGLAPLTREIILSLKERRIDLGFPIIITILILLVLGQLRIAAIFVMFVLLGQYFKDYIISRVRQSIADMAKSLPDTAFILRGSELIQIKIAQIKAGDLLVVKAGGSVPVDGILLETDASLDESIISGESRPVAKKQGEKIIAGAINLSDNIMYKALDTNQNSTISQIQNLVKNAQADSAPLSQFTNTYAKITSFVALVLVVTFYLLTRNILQALAIWVALVPVVFAIIVPVATTIGIALLAKKGVLVKNAGSLENLTKIDTIVFDKTGTLTKGKPEIEKITTISPYSQRKLLQIVSSVERYSEHHLADSILARSQAENIPLLPVTNTHIVKGRGISGFVNKKLILVGNKKFLEENGITVSPPEQSDNTTVFVSIEGKPAGIISFADQLREEAKEVIQKLKTMNMKVIILSGDNKNVGSKIAAEIGIAEVYCELKPEDKISIIKRLQKEGRKIAMVGDGINDAPALASSNVGIAMGLKGVDITLKSARIVLVHDDLSRLPEIITSSKTIFKIIRTNLFLASTIHALTALLVMANVIGILESAVFHEISSFLVLANTMRIFNVSPSKIVVTT